MHIQVLPVLITHRDLNSRLVPPLPQRTEQDQMILGIQSSATQVNSINEIQANNPNKLFVQEEPKKIIYCIVSLV